MQAYYDVINDDPELMRSIAMLAEDLETSTEVIETYLRSAPPAPKKVYIGGGEIIPCWMEM